LKEFGMVKGTSGFIIWDGYDSVKGHTWGSSSVLTDIKMDGCSLDLFLKVRCNDNPKIDICRNCFKRILLDFIDHMDNNFDNGVK